MIDIMFLSYFDYMKRRIGAVKDDSNFIKKYGRNFMRAFQEEMEYTALKAIVDPSIDFNLSEKLSGGSGFSVPGGP